MELELSKEEAVRLHREMWSDMQKEYGDNPSKLHRYLFKKKWTHERHKYPYNDCFLCEYDNQFNEGDEVCVHCPIAWGDGDCTADPDFRTSPISEILDLPVNEDA